MDEVNDVLRRPVVNNVRNVVNVNTASSYVGADEDVSVAVAESVQTFFTDVLRFAAVQCRYRFSLLGQHLSNLVDLEL